MNKHQRGFTLIELLVVIAIIAILAAILFPVFASAKGAAKKAASVSNSKQLCLGVTMYANDYDDYVPPATAWNPQNFPGDFPISFGDGWASPWSCLCGPYLKSGQVYYDPQAPSRTPGADDPTLMAMLYPHYGYNYTYLSAWDGSHQTPISMTSAAKPSETVMLSAKWSIAETDLNFGTFIGWQFNYASDAPLLNMTVDSPNCNDIPQFCVSNWGIGSFGSAKTVESGRDTGANSVRSGQQCVVAWLDGHVGAMNPFNLAKGTTWTPTSNPNDVKFTASWQSVYLWDLQ